VMVAQISRILAADGCSCLAGRFSSIVFRNCVGH
jgi:hypothetical protein